MAGLMYEGSSLPPSVSQAAMNYLDYQKAIKNKLPLAVEGSAVPDSVRKAAQAAIERGASPQAAPAAPSPLGNWMEGTRGNISGADVKGLLSKGAGMVGKAAGAAGRALGPAAAAYEGVGELNQMFGPAKYQNIQNMMAEARTREDMKADPELAERGQSTVDRITGNAMQGVQGLMPQQEQQQGLTPEEMAAEAPQEAPMQPPQQSPMEVPAQPEPVAPEIVKEQQQRQVEAQRQTIQEGTLKGLQTGAVSVSELANGVVEADAQRAGTNLTPVEKKKAVETEVQAMKTMDKSNLSRYVSYALIAGGLLASVLDKSGSAGAAFSNSFNKQLDRNLAAGKMSAEMYNNALDRQIKERDLARKETDSAVDAKYKGGLLSQGERKIDQGDRGLDQGDKGLTLKEKAIDQTGRIASADLGIKQQGVTLQGEKLKQSIANSNRNYELEAQKVGLMKTNPEADRASREKIAAENAAARVAAAQQKLQSGVSMSNKEAVSTVQTIAKERGDNISDAVAQSVAAYIPTAQKLNPGMSPNEIYEFALQKQAGKLVQEEQWMGFGKPQVQIRKRKDDAKK